MDRVCKCRDLPLCDRRGLCLECDQPPGESWADGELRAQARTIVELRAQVRRLEMRTTPAEAWDEGHNAAPGTPNPYLTGLDLPEVQP